ncbi:MAG TPA: S53 family serine peptidase [Candidatus Binataceae bacterium]|nr:S53 family serine peptidase [Candidatus Binataceae bacterium]
MNSRGAVGHRGSGAGGIRAQIFGFLAGAAAAIVAVSMPLCAEAYAGTTAIAGNHSEEAAGLAGEGVVAPERALRMEIVLALRNRAELDRLAADQVDSSSPRYHRWLSSAEFNARFGPTQSDVAALTRWLEQSGFTIQSASASRRSIVFTGSAEKAQKAFSVRIAASADGKTYANLDDPAVPEKLAPLIGTIRGLSNMMRAVPVVSASLARRPPSLPAVTEGGVTAFGPQDLWTFYDYNSLQAGGIDGTGTDCIGLVENSNWDSSGVTAFDTTFALPAANVTQTFADGSDPGIIDGADTEAELDVEYSHAAAPGAPIVAYIGSDAASKGNGLPDAIARAIHDNTCGAVSISFAFCGADPAFFTKQLDPLFAEAAAHGQGVYVSAGDWGAAGLGVDRHMNCVVTKARKISEMAGDPNVTAVGGTSFNPTYNSSGLDVGNVAETVWHDGNKEPAGTTGGGRSSLFKKPAFQTASTPKDKARDIPDISLGASPNNPGYFFGDSGSILCCIGGTSLSAPYWAGIAQLVAQQAGEARAGNLNAKIYALGALGNAASSGLRDVTTGNNSFNGVAGYAAGIGYDRASGWGTPDIGVFVPAAAGK